VLEHLRTSDPDTNDRRGDYRRDRWERD
jgi:hypothetical protein